jgi:hypothetical protein
MCDSPIPDAFPGPTRRPRPPAPRHYSVGCTTASAVPLSCRQFDPSPPKESIVDRQPSPTYSVLNLELSTLNLRCLSLFLATPTGPGQLVENPATLSPLFATLTRSVAPKFFACHSYTKTPGVRGTLLRRASIARAASLSAPFLPHRNADKANRLRHFRHRFRHTRGWGRCGSSFPHYTLFTIHYSLFTVHCRGTAAAHCNFFSIWGFYAQGVIYR